MRGVWLIVAGAACLCMSLVAAFVVWYGWHPESIRSATSPFALACLSLSGLGAALALAGVVLLLIDDARS